MIAPTLFTFIKGTSIQVHYVYPVVPKVTVEALMDMLRELEPKWLVLGEAFGVPEHILDIIDTEDERRSTCMREMLKEYLQRGDATPTWRNVANTLHLMGEASLAEKIEEKYGIGELTLMKAYCGGVIICLEAPL